MYPLFLSLPSLSLYLPPLCLHPALTSSDDVGELCLRTWLCGTVVQHHCHATCQWSEHRGLSGEIAVGLLLS